VAVAVSHLLTECLIERKQVARVTVDRQRAWLRSRMPQLL
jgi:hypothetical protein